MTTQILLFAQIIACSVAILFDRNGIDVIHWEQLQQFHMQNKLNLGKPFIVTGSPSSEWTLLDNNYRGLATAFEHYDKLSIDTRSTDCSCFKLKNNTIDIETCYQFVSTFKYISNDKQQRFHTHKSSSYWDTYEAYFAQEYPYEKCIKRYRAHKSMQYILKHWDEFVMNDKENDLNQKKARLTSRRISFNVITNKFGQLMYDQVSNQVMNHIDLAPYFPIFGLKYGLQSLHDMMLWFGSNNYKLIRHTDTSHNLFFVLNGTKKFVLSPPLLVNHKDFPFIVYPYIHPSARSAYNLYKIYGVQYNTKASYGDMLDVDIHKDEFLYLPSGWWHEVTNNQHGSIAINIWFGERASDMKQQLHQVKLPISSPNVGKNELDGILYLINRITQYFEHEYIHPQYGFMFNYFRKMYPILDAIYYDNLVFAINDRTNTEWLNMIIDIRNIIRCDGNKDVYHLLHYISYLCHIPTKKQKWDQAIAEFYNLFDAADEMIPLGHLQEIVAAYLETVLFYINDETVFSPILIAIHNL